MFDTGAVSNRMSTELARELSFTPEITAKNIRMANVSTAIIKRLVRAVPVWFAEGTADLDCFVIDDMPVSKKIGIPTLEKMKSTLHLEQNFVTLRIVDEELQIFHK